ncbi:MAG TPA: VOC family protein [Actinophytocola sp.]|jgi:catechol 2,3-dioxygenase-like lactoylglutathione lyase family enzyme|uniref:VOC family protein n=1 Tax=Actinophytocola sp. TaxID=1872138 RepID=UPI002F92318D
MIDAVSHIGIFVLDQDEALDFYVGKLGFEVHTDARMGDYRWLTVTPPGQPELQVMLAVPGPPAVDADTAERIKSLVTRGHMGAGILSTKDCRRTYEELVARGVEFTEKPTDRFYGVDAAFRDNSGNLWRITEPVENPPREFPPS